MKTSPLLCLFLGIAWLGQAGAGNADVAFTGEIYGGTLDDDLLGNDTVLSGYGNVTVPLMNNFGLHLEALAEDWDQFESQNIGGHLYWRNPQAGLLGLIVSHSEFDEFGLNTDVDGVGAEAELYLGMLSLAAQYARLDSDDVLLDGEDYTAAEAHLTPADAWYLSGGVRGAADFDTVYAEVNFRPTGGTSPLNLYGGATWDELESQYIGISYDVMSRSNSNLAVFLEADQGQEDGVDFNGVFLGVTFTHGPVENAPLITLFSDLKGGF